MQLYKTMVSDRLKFLISSAFHFLIQLVTYSVSLLVHMLIIPHISSYSCFLVNVDSSLTLLLFIVEGTTVNIYVPAIASTMLLCHHFSILLF